MEPQQPPNPEGQEAPAPEAPLAPAPEALDTATAETTMVSVPEAVPPITAPGPEAAPPPSMAPPPPPAQPVPAAPAPFAWQPVQAEIGPAPGVKFAGHGGRLVACIIDVIIVGVIWVVLTVIPGLGYLRGVSQGDESSDSVIVASITTFALILPSVLYFPWFWARGGQTPGMKVFRLRIVRDVDGGSIGWGAAILRYIGFMIINWIIFGLPIGFIWIFIDKRRRGWHDLIAGTVVIEQ